VCGDMIATDLWRSLTAITARSGTVSVALDLAEMLKAACCEVVGRTGCSCCSKTVSGDAYMRCHACWLSNRGPQTPGLTMT
jgi:hypothetical protein